MSNLVARAKLHLDDAAANSRYGEGFSDPQVEVLSGIGYALLDIAAAVREHTYAITHQKEVKKDEPELTGGKQIYSPLSYT